MDKYLITSFKSEIANAILNMQDKLNPNKDAYIDKDELKGVLDFFGVDDISKLLKPNAEQSIFEDQSNKAATQSNEDTIEFSNYEDGDEDDALNTYGTAAFELNTKVKADLSINTAGNPYTQQLDALQKEKVIKDKKGADSLDTEYKIDALNNMVRDYMKEHPNAEKEHLTINKIYYGKNGKKEALMSQTFGISGNKAFKPTEFQPVNDTKSDSKESKDSGTDETSDNSDNKNTASAVVSYNIDFRTLNDKNKGNWHLKGTVNAGSDNSDIQGAIQYTKVFKNDSSLNFTGNLRETIENKNNIGSYGASIDYRLKKFSTGGYAMYYHKEVEGEKDKEKYLEVYGKYGNTFIGAAGLKQDGDANYKFAKGLIQGKREFPNSSLAIHGGLGLEYEVSNDQDGINEKEILLKAKGGIAFKSKDLCADVSVNASTSNITTRKNGEDPLSTRTTSVAFLGKVETKNFDILTAVSALNVNEKDNVKENTTDNKTSVIASIIVGIKNLFGKNVMPTLRYNVGNYDGAAQNLGVGVIITP